jgi:hypothetical protein
MHVGIALVALAQLRDALVGAVQPARQVVAAGELHRGRGLGEEVGVERDDALDLVQRAPPLARQAHQLFAREPAVLALDRVEVGDQAGAGEAARARLGTRDAADQARLTPSVRRLGHASAGSADSPLLCEAASTSLRLSP